MQILVRSHILLAVFYVTAALQAQNQPQDKPFTAHSFERQVTVRVQSALFLPKAYDANTDQLWPLILFLHGAGERGANVWQVNVHGPARYIPEHPGFPFIVVSPQCPAEQTWSNDVLLELLDDVSAKYKVDPRRVYLTGLSMGGFGTWSLALAHPEKFAAAAPICGGSDTLDIILAKIGFTSPERNVALKSLPIWAFHGAKDTVVPPVESERMVRALKELGAQEVKLTLYPEADHNSWTQTYSNPEFYKWLLEHRRDK